MKTVKKISEVTEGLERELIFFYSYLYTFFIIFFLHWNQY